jgi:hypothetical protein
MIGILSAIARLIGIGGVLFIGLLLYEEGIPGANRIPFLTSIPIIGDLTAGRVHTYAAQQVTLATSNMVTKFERDTIASQLAEMERQRNAAAQATEEHRKRLEAAESEITKSENTREAEIRGYELILSQKNRACIADSDDRTFILRH